MTRMFGLLYHPNEYCGGVCSVLKQNVLASFLCDVFSNNMFPMQIDFILKSKKQTLATYLVCLRLE